MLKNRTEANEKWLGLANMQAEANEKWLGLANMQAGAIDWTPTR